MKFFFLAGGILGFLAVAAGAFGAHALRTRLPADLLTIFETAARYQMYHALALFAVAWAKSQWANSYATAAGWLFIVGVLVFCGSLYILAFTGIRWLGAITPLGGVALLAGWACLTLAALRS